MKDTLPNIPEELKLDALWCAWKYVTNDDGDLVKKPFNVLNGYGAKSNNASTFVSYPTLCRYLDNYLSFDGETGRQMGGAGLGIFKGYSAIDIDHCVDENGTISDMAQELIDFCKSYTEFSPSKTGIRIIFRSAIYIDKNKYYINNAKRGLEIYISDNTNKFVTITGNKLSGDSIATVDLSSMLEKYMKRETPIYTGPVVTRNDVNVSIDYALTKDYKLFQLWTNQAPGSHSNESELDMALACKLAFYCNNDTGKMMELFMQSPYYASKDEKHKNKWAGVYGTNTINAATNFNVQRIEYKPQEQINEKPRVVQQVEAYEAKRELTTTRYALTDTGNAHRFADKFKDNIHYNFDNEKWMLWNGKFWEYDIKDKIRDYVDIIATEMLKDLRNEDDDVKRKLIASNINKIQNNSGKKALLEECEHIDDIPVLNSDFDIDKYLLCANNMVYDLYNGTQLDFDRKYKMSQCINCDIDLENEPKRWIQFLNEIFEYDQEMIRYVRKVWAYGLSASTREQAMWIFYGDGNNGKSLALEIINELMGSYAITSRPELLVDSKNSNTTQEEIARLAHKRAIFMEEIKDGDRLNESLVKQATSGIGKMTGRFLYGNTFELTVIGKIFMASNYKPKIKGIDKGIWRRINLVPLYKDFSNSADKDLRDKLIAELPQIAGWLCKGFKLYLEEGLEKPQKVINETKEYKDESDIVQTWINENCEIDKASWTKATELFDDFVIWCKHNQETVLTQTAFGRNMGKKFRRLAYSTGKVYSGIKLRVKPEDFSKKVAYDLVDINEEDI